MNSEKPKNSYWVGLTGGIASGKSAVGSYLSAWGVDVIDADQVARQVVEPGRRELKQIAQTFGDEFIQDDGYLNRRKLRERIFASDNDRLTLEKILHKAIRSELITQARLSQSQYTVLMVPILNKIGLGQHLDQTVIVDCDPAAQLQRLIQRDDMNESGARAMIAAQETREQRLESASLVIKNNADLESLKAKAAELHQQLCKLTKHTPATDS